MSDKKNELPKDQQDPLSEVEIVIMGTKNPIPLQTPSKDKEQSHPVVINKEPEQDQGQQGLEDMHLHAMPSVGDPSGEEKIRQHVQQIMRKEMIEKIEEGGESQSQNAPQESNISNKSSKSSKSLKKDAKSQSNQQRKEELPTSRKCFNKLCTSKKIYKKIRSRVEDNKYRFFCKNCYENYYNNLYCEFCEQIYSNTSQNEDDDKWIGCDHCQRWNHIQCEKRYRDKNIHDLKDKNLLYQCLVCAHRTKNVSDKVKKGEKEPVQQKIITKQKIEINRDQRTLIFHKKNETFPNLEYFLQNYSFRLWMNEGQIRQDLEHLRSSCHRQPQQQIKNKMKKIKND